MFDFLKLYGSWSAATTLMLRGRMPTSVSHLKTHSREKSNQCNQCVFASFQPRNSRTQLDNFYTQGQKPPFTLFAFLHHIPLLSLSSPTENNHSLKLKALKAPKRKEKHMSWIDRPLASESTYFRNTDSIFFCLLVWFGFV